MTVKKFKFVFLSAVIALFCFAAMASAAKSVQVIDHDVDSKGPYYTQFVETDGYDPYLSDGDIASGAFTVANVPTSELLEKFVPASYKGNVSADCYYRIQLAQKGAITASAIPASNYQIWGATTADLQTKIDAFMKAISDDAEMFILVPATGEPVSVDKVMVKNSMVSGTVPEFTITAPLTLPVSIYAVRFTDNPIPIIKHAVTATAGTGGTITPASADVEEGASCEFVITADKGYVIDALTVDNSAVADAAGNASYTYTLENVTKAAKISVTFKKSIEPGKENVSEIGASGEGVTAAEPVFVEASDKIVASFDAQADNSKELPLVKADGTSDQNVTFKKEAFVCAVKLDVTHTDAAAAMTLAFSPAKDKTFDAAKKYYAMILNKKTGAYAIFECAQANGKLNMTVRPVGDYFSENTVVVYTGTATNAGGDTPSTGGGGGCNAGMAALALLALVPLALRRKK